MSGTAAPAPRLSVLDQSPVGAGFPPANSLRESVELAQAAEELGYVRYWTAEHHGSPGFAGCAPEILAAIPLPGPRPFACPLKSANQSGGLAGSPHGLYGVWVMEEISR
ncbi:LLM class flavin-dependent oxidoreductase [Streptomyces sp. NPDC001604]|uniref:LLM class flavin-dependent oxidoreductase n=1 Tax=Streptomyces sp. NPDC001604 TaxID=3364593 RepID=UPI0036CB0FE8